MPSVLSLSGTARRRPVAMWAVRADARQAFIAALEAGKWRLIITCPRRPGGRGLRAVRALRTGPPRTVRDVRAGPRRSSPARDLLALASLSEQRPFTRRVNGCPVSDG